MLLFVDDVSSTPPSPINLFCFFAFFFAFSLFRQLLPPYAILMLAACPPLIIDAAIRHCYVHIVDNGCFRRYFRYVIYARLMTVPYYSLLYPPPYHMVFRCFAAATLFSPMLSLSFDIFRFSFRHIIVTTTMFFFFFFCDTSRHYFAADAVIDFQPFCMHTFLFAAARFSAPPVFFFFLRHTLSV